MSTRSPRALVAALALVGALLIVPGATAAKVFPNCKAVNRSTSTASRRTRSERSSQPVSQAGHS